MHWLNCEPLCEPTFFLCISVLRVAAGPRVKLASCKSALTPPVVYSSDRSMAMVPVLVLFFFALWFILQGDLFYVLCYFVPVLFSPYSIAITSLRVRERANISAFRTFVRFACLVLSVSSSSWCHGRAAVRDFGTPWTFLSLFFFLLLGKELPTRLAIYFFFCGCLIVFVYLSIWYRGLDVNLIVSIPKFNYNLYLKSEKVTLGIKER